MTTLKLGSRGADVKTLQGYLGLAQDGSFGPKTEAAVKEFQSSHGLTPDGVVGQKTWSLLTSEGGNDPRVIPGVTIYKPIGTNITRLPGRKIKYLVIHYTAGTRSTSGAALAARNVFLTRKASADFCVDDTDIVQVNPDLRNYYCYAVGDGKGKYGITNSNSISIEICSTLQKGTTAAVPNHSGWSFTDTALANAMSLAKTLMSVFQIPLSRVVRHYDASGKYCPGIIGWNPGARYNPTTGKIIPGVKNSEEEWNWFKDSLRY